MTSILLVVAGGIGVAAAEDCTEASIGDSRLTAGDVVVLDEPIDGNAFAAGSRVEVRERVDGSVFLSGGSVTVTGPVGRNLYAAGGEVRIEGDVEGRARAAGGKLRVAREARIGGSAAFAGELVVSADFENGSVAVDGIDQQTGTIRFRPGGDARRGWPCWWYFRDDGVAPGRMLTIELDRTTQPLRGNRGGQRRQTTPARLDTPPALAKETDRRSWSFSAYAYYYFVPDDSNILVPVVTADRGRLHLEARYNYEDRDTGSAWIGYNLRFGKNLTWDVTPMVGAVFGDTNGAAPGYKSTLRW